MVEYEHQKDLANRIIKSGIIGSHEGNHLMNVAPEMFYNRLKHHYPQAGWDAFLQKHGARYVGLMGDFVIKEMLMGQKFEIFLKGDEGKDVLIDGKWWDIKTSMSGEPKVMANQIRHPETYGFIFCYYDPPDRLLIQQYDLAEDVFNQVNFKKKGDQLRFKTVQFDCYMPPEKKKRWDGKSYQGEEIDKFLGLK